MTFNPERFARAVHYIVWKTGKLANFGAVKLNKVLWFAEARVYVLHRRYMTGETYVKEKYGPVPKHIMQARTQLERAGLIEIWEDRGNTRFRTNIRPDMGDFEAEDLKQLDYWIGEIAKETAASISEKTHDYGWEIAAMGEKIPLYAILAERARPPKGKELEWAREAAERLGLP